MQGGGGSRCGHRRPTTTRHMEIRQAISSNKNVSVHQTSSTIGPRISERKSGKFYSRAYIQHILKYNKNRQPIKQWVWRLFGFHQVSKTGLYDEPYGLVNIFLQFTPTTRRFVTIQRTMSVRYGSDGMRENRDGIRSDSTGIKSDRNEIDSRSRKRGSVYLFRIKDPKSLSLKSIYNKVIRQIATNLFIDLPQISSPKYHKSLR